MQVYNSNLYGYIKNYKLICLMCIMLYSISCTNTESYEDTEEYSFYPLTLELIKQLGGIDELSKYQFYLSNSFELSRVENEKSFTDKGYVNNLDNNFKIIFNIHTPGIFYRYDNMSSWHEIDGIDILFDENDNDYLTFKIEKDAYNRNTARFYHANGTNNPRAVSTFDMYPYFKKVGKEFHSSNDALYKYKDLAWKKTMILSRKEKRDSKYCLGETYLIIRIKNLSTTTTDKAKGRTLSE